MQVRQLLTQQGVMSEQEVLKREHDGYKTFTDIEIPQEAKKDYEEFPFVTPKMKSCQQLWFVVPHVRFYASRLVVLANLYIMLTQELACPNGAVKQSGHLACCQLGSLLSLTAAVYSKVVP